MKKVCCSNQQEVSCLDTINNSMMITVYFKNFNIQLLIKVYSVKKLAN